MEGEEEGDEDDEGEGKGERSPVPDPKSDAIATGPGGLQPAPRPPSTPHAPESWGGEHLQMTTVAGLPHHQPQARHDR